MAGNNGRSGPLLALVGQEKDVAFYVREVESRRAPVLVLGAGTGRIAWELALHGHTTVAVEPSEVMVESAEDRRRYEPPEASDRLRLITADPRALRIPERFPVILAPQNALALNATLDDLDAMLATVRHHLTDDGVFAFDVLNPRTPRIPEGTPPAEGWHPQEGIEPPRPLFAPHLRERTRTPEGVTEGIRRLRLRHFSVAEIDQALEEAAFTATERYGTFDRRPFEQEDAVQVVIAIRSEPG